MNRRKSLLVFALSPILASLVLAPLAPAQPAKRPMTFEDMMQMKRLGETAVSPDGQWLAYSVGTVNLDANTITHQWWLKKISGGQPETIAVTQPNDSGLQFSADGKQILFLSSRTGAQQIWLADFDPATGVTSNAKQLTTIVTGADNAQWAPNDQSIIFTSFVYPDCTAITYADNAGNKCNADKDAAAAASKVKAQIFTHLLYRHWNHFTGDKRSHLFQVQVASGQPRDLTPNDPHDVPPFSLEGGGGFSISPDSKELAFTENPDPVPAISTSAQIYTLDLTNPEAKPVKISTSAGGNFTPAYSPDGKYIAWRSQARPGYESDEFRFALYDRSTKAIKYLLSKFDRWVDEIAWGPTSGWIYFIAGDQGYEQIYALNLAPDFSKNNPDWIPAQLTREGTYSDLRPESNGEVLIATRNSVRNPGEVVALNSTSVGHMAFDIGYGPGVELPIANHQILDERQLTHLNDTLLAQLDLPAMESFWFTAKDGVKVQGFLIRPPNFDPNKKYPVKFLIHGGPQGAWGDDWSYRWNAELFAANGYVVVMINPRGSTGYGQKFVEGVSGDWGGKPFTDLMTGLDYAEQHYPFIDKSRECALGASYGGYMANWILGHTGRFKCIVTHDGMFNAESAFGSTDELWFNTWEFQGHPWDYYGKPDSENPFRKWSPSLYAKNFKTPTLVVHSQLDYRLDLSEGLQLFTTLQLLHVPSKMLYFPDEGHWVLKPQNSRLWYKTVNDWVDQWTKTSH